MTRRLTESLFAEHRYKDSAIRIRPGDAVTWRYETNRGWGYVFHVPAYVVKVGPKRIGIGASKLNDEWVPRWVKPESLTAREPYAADLRGVGRRDDERGRGVLRAVQDERARRASLDQREVPAALLGRVHVPVEPPEGRAAYLLDDPRPRPEACSRRRVDRSSALSKSRSEKSGSCFSRTSAGASRGLPVLFFSTLRSDVIGTMIRACPKGDTENGGWGTCSPCSDEHQPWLRRRWHACPVHPPCSGETPHTRWGLPGPSRVVLLTMEVRRRGSFLAPIGAKKSSLVRRDGIAQPVTRAVLLDPVVALPHALDVSLAGERREHHLQRGRTNSAAAIFSQTRQMFRRSGVGFRAARTTPTR